MIDHHIVQAAIATLNRDDFSLRDDGEGGFKFAFDDDTPQPDQATLDEIISQADAMRAIVDQATFIDTIVAERERRMRLGFDYDFQDARGVHRIGTTDLDMAGWREVDDLASAYEYAGLASTPIDIVTDTGPCQITPAEWLGPMKLAFAAFRQPIWGASFALQAMQPRPTDVTDNAYWP